MNIVFTCGGTGGHIYPAIAVARMFRERQPDCRILFILSLIHISEPTRPY